MLILIYVLIVGWFSSFKVPAVMMIAIPLALVGVLPAHAAFGVFFTATSMIGFIALAGIMVRNSVLLIDFINLSQADGKSLRDAVLEAGAVRFRPILLTAGTVVVGAVVILFDPIFQGLAVFIHLLGRWKVPAYLRVLLYVMLVIQSYGLVLITLLGIGDTWMNLRPEKEDEPPSQGPQSDSDR